MVEFSELNAQRYGISCAILCRQMLKKNEAKPVFSLSDLVEIFPFWTKRQLRKIIADAIRHEILIEKTANMALQGSAKMYIFNPSFDQSERTISCELEVNGYDLNCSEYELTINESNKTGKQKMFVTKVVRFDYKTYCSKNIHYQKVTNIAKLLGCSKNIHYQKVTNIDLKINKKEVLFIANTCLLFICAVQKETPTVTRVYRIYYNILNIYILFKNTDVNLLNKNTVNKTKHFSKQGAKKVFKNYPDSGAHYFNSRLVLNELNNLVFPDLRRAPFELSAENLQPILRQMRGGATVQDCLHVIAVKHAQWQNVACMQASLNPRTLFGSKYEAYLGEKTKKEFNHAAKQKSRSPSRQQAADIYAQLGSALSAREIESGSESGN